MTTATFTPASFKQVQYLAALADQRDLPADFTVPDPLSKEDAHRLIELAVASPRKAAPALETGYYLHQGDVYTVVENQAKTGTYAKVLVIVPGDKPRARWKYTPGMMGTLAGSPRLTVAEAANLGHLHGVCVVCGKRLTDPASVQAGIGPVCINRI